MVFSATFNTISANSWQSVLLVEVNRSIRRKPPTCHKSLTNFITKYCFEYTSPSTGFELTTLVVMGTNCVCSCNFNYHMIKNTTSPYYIKHNYLIKWKTKNTTPLAQFENSFVDSQKQPNLIPPTHLCIRTHFLCVQVWGYFSLLTHTTFI